MGDSFSKGSCGILNAFPPTYVVSASILLEQGGDESYAYLNGQVSVGIIHHELEVWGHVGAISEVEMVNVNLHLLHLFYTDYTGQNAVSVCANGISPCSNHVKKKGSNSQAQEKECWQPYGCSGVKRKILETEKLTRTVLT